MINKIIPISFIKMFFILLFFIVICSASKHNVESDIYKIVTEYLGENPVDSSIQLKKITFKDGRYCEVDYLLAPFSIRYLLYDENKEIIMDSLIVESMGSKIERYFYDEQGNYAKVECTFSNIKDKYVAKHKNYYGTDNRIKKHIRYDFDSNITNIYIFNYDTLGYSKVEHQFDYPDTIPSTTYYYKNDLLIKTEKFWGEVVLEYEYDSLNRFIYEDKDRNERCYYSYIGDLLDKIVNIRRQTGDTLSTTTYQHFLDSLHRPIKTIATTVSNRNKEKVEKKLTITEYR